MVVENPVYIAQESSTQWTSLDHGRQNRHWNLNQLRSDSLPFLAAIGLVVLTVASFISAGAISNRILPGQQPTIPANTDFDTLTYENNSPKLTLSSLISNQQGFLHLPPTVSGK